MHVDGCVICGKQPHVIEVGPSVIERLDAMQRDMCALGGKDADGAASDAHAESRGVHDDGDVESRALVGNEVDGSRVGAPVDAAYLDACRVA